MIKKSKQIVLLVLLVFGLTACNLPGLGADAEGQDVVVVGSSTSEGQILAELGVQMVNHYLPEIKTDIVSNVAATIMRITALQNGDANVGGSFYTGTSLTGELGMDPITDPAKALQAVVKGYYDKYDMVWMPSYGFENSYAFMIRQEFADEHNIEKISDLTDMAPDLRAGVDTGWMERPGDGYDAFKEIYFDFGQVFPMQIGLVYDAVAAGEMDVVLGYSTDGRIQSNELVVIEDDMNLFPPYDASAVITMDILVEHPELEEVFLRLDQIIDAPEMQELNRISDEDKIEPRIVAENFLKENNYFEDKEIIPLSQREDYLEISKDLEQRIQESEME